MTENEVNFPRGGVKITREKGFTHASNNVSFPKQGNRQKKTGDSKKRKRSVSPDVAQTTELFATATADALTYKKLQERMLLLGCIRTISPLSLEVELPGKMGGKIKINSISQHYTELLTKEFNEGDVEERKDVARLNTMFHVGQFLPTRVIEKAETTKGTKVNLSIDPQEINADWNHTVFRKGLLVWAAVISELDHGYQLDAGVANSRIFLPNKNVTEGAALITGQPLWCIVQKSDVTSTASTITVSILEEHLNAATQDSAMSLHYLVPGMQFNFKISKAVKFGLQGEFMNHCLGYINEGYLATPLERVSKYREGQDVKARLLYVQPTIKLSHFTLRNLQTAPAPEYEIGKKLRAQVISKGGGGINIKLPNNEKGFVTYKRLGLQMLPNQNNLMDAVGKKFPPGSSHQCRILNYIRLERVYICSFEQSILKEKHLTISDVKLGELVTVKVQKSTAEGLQVLLGNVNCFIQNIHLCDSLYSENIKKSFTKGRTLQARVWNIDSRGVNLTCKQALKNSDLCLSSYEDALVNHQYPGVVVNKSARTVLVMFYGGVRGLLLKKQLCETFEDYTDDMFYVGQVIMTTVTKVKSNVLYLSCDPPRKAKRETLNIGKYVDGVVTAINQRGLTVEAGPNKIQAFVPVAHLSSSLTLTPLLLDTYKVGDTLEGLLCISSGKNPMLSLREAVAYKKQNLEIGKIEELQVGSIIRCSYVDADTSGIYVMAPFTSHSMKLKISNKELPNECHKIIKFQQQQTIIAKVVKLDIDNKIAQVTTQLSEVFNYDYQYSLDLLERYLQDVKQIETYLLQSGSPLATLQLGQRVECEICSVTDNGCSVLLQDNIKGFVPVKHYPKNIKSGQTLMGVVLWVNYRDEFVEISLNRKVIEKINEVQDGDIDKPFGSSLHAVVLINTPEYVVALLRNQEANQQLIFLPPRLHENSIVEDTKYEEMEKTKVIVCRNLDNKLIGMDKQYIHRLMKMSKRKRKIGASATTPSKKRRVHNKPTKNTLHSENETAYDGLEGDKDNYKPTDIVNHESESEEEATDVSHEVIHNEDNDQDQSEDEGSSYENRNGNNSEDEDGSYEAENSSKCGEELSDNDESNQNVTDEGEYFNSNEDANELEQSDSDDTEGDYETNIKGNKRKVKSVNKDSPSPQNGNSEVLRLPGVLNFYTEQKRVHFDIPPTSDQDVPKVSNKKLTPAERKEQARLEEEALLKKEIENADSTAEPQTLEQFQKLVKGKPNCSESWIKYISHLVANAEIEKAKGVVQEALATISIDLTQERYNIWIAQLNLENNYGDKNTFNGVFEEAVRCNDDLKIYMEAINILSDSQKYTEMEEKIQKAKKKFKNSMEMWYNIGEIYYKNGKFKDARNLKGDALKTVRNKLLEFKLVTKFAIMEFKYGEKNHGEALFETILQHDPKRVDIWSTYVDQVIKTGDIDGARRILERAISQSIPPKKLKTLFKKFKDFESTYGTEENVEHVLELAKKYVSMH